MTKHAKGVVSTVVLVAVCLVLRYGLRSNDGSAEKTPAGNAKGGVAGLSSTENPSAGDEVVGGIPALRAPDKWRELNDAFEYPFLGRVSTHSSLHAVHVTAASGKLKLLEIKVHVARDGRFIRAEYKREGSEDGPTLPGVNEANYESSSEKITGLPNVSPGTSLQALLDTLHGHYGGNFEDASYFDITYVMLSRPGGPATPMFIANVYGTARISSSLPDLPKFYRLRFLFDTDGKLLLIDDVL